jgi:Flp pilus assembly protein CpaB
VNSRRTVIIVAALVLAALAFFGNVYYLDGAQQRAYKNAKLVDVWVVKKSIPKGLDGSDAIAQNYVQLGEIPQQYRPGSAIGKGDIDQIKGNVAINTLSPGQILVGGQFVSPTVAQVTFAQRVPAGQVAISVSVDQVHGVAGLLMPGDKVDMLVTGKEDPKDPTSCGWVNPSPTQSNSSGLTVPCAQVLYQNVNILAIGNSAAPQVGDTTATTAASSANSGLITFSVPLAAAQHIAVVSGDGGNTAIYLALVPADSQPLTSGLSDLNLNNAFNNLPSTGTPYTS